MVGRRQDARDLFADTRVGVPGGGSEVTQDHHGDEASEGRDSRLSDTAHGRGEQANELGYDSGVLQIAERDHDISQSLRLSFERL